MPELKHPSLHKKNGPQANTVTAEGLVKDKLKEFEEDEGRSPTKKEERQITLAAKRAVEYAQCFGIPIDVWYMLHESDRKHYVKRKIFDDKMRSLAARNIAAHKQRWHVKSARKRDPNNNFAPASTYDHTWMDEFALKLYAEGAFDNEVMLELCIDANTFNDWVNGLDDSGKLKHPSFSVAVAQGRKLSEQWWVRKAKENAEYGTLNMNIWYAFMKNKFGWTEKLEATGKDGAPLFTLADMAKLATSASTSPDNSKPLPK